VGSVFVRLGNFFNSEIIGRVTDVPWAVVFVRRDALPRHPSQLYEALGGLVVLVVLLALARRRDTRPGLLAGVFVTGYFTFRFLVEFLKAYAVPTGFFTMGQYLSVPFILFGIGLMVAACRKQRGAE
jgi:phosphatidylglycerol---prolipoprotein diacylglyceryl transferase